MRRFNRLVLAAILGLGLTVGVLSVASARLGPSVDSMTTAWSLDGTSVNTSIDLIFTEPMDRSSVDRTFHVRPKLPGSVSWAGNELFFTPRHSLRYDTSYSVTVSSGAKGTSGKHLARAFHASFRTQSEHLLYLGTQGSERGHLVLASIAGRRQTVGSGGLVTEFSLSIDRSLAVYVRRGAPGERPDELWLLSLADDSAQRVFRRPDWNIREPHLSPDGKTIVFLATNVRICQKYYGCYRDKTGPIIYLLDLGSHKVRPFLSKSDVPITDFVDFSPAGQLAYTDLGSALVLSNPNGQGVIHIPNQGNSLQYVEFSSAGDKAAFVGQTPSSTGGDILVYENRGGRYVDVSNGVYDSSTPSFSSSGSEVAYAAYRGEKGIEPVYGINAYDFKTGRTQRLTNPRPWSDWEPQWSVDDRYLAFIRSQPQEAMYMGSGEIWMVSSDGRGARPLGGVGTNVRWVV